MRRQRLATHKSRQLAKSEKPHWSVKLLVGVLLLGSGASVLPIPDVFGTNHEAYAEDVGDNVTEDALDLSLASAGRIALWDGNSVDHFTSADVLSDTKDDAGLQGELADIAQTARTEIESGTKDLAFPIEATATNTHSDDGTTPLSLTSTSVVSMTIPSGSQIQTLNGESYGAFSIVIALMKNGEYVTNSSGENIYISLPLSYNGNTTSGTNAIKIGEDRAFSQYGGILTANYDITFQFAISDLESQMPADVKAQVYNSAAYTVDVKQQLDIENSSSKNWYLKIRSGSLSFMSKLKPSIDKTTYITDSTDTSYQYLLIEGTGTYANDVIKFYLDMNDNDRVDSADTALTVYTPKNSNNEVLTADDGTKYWGAILRLSPEQAQTLVDHPERMLVEESNSIDVSGDSSTIIDVPTQTIFDPNDDPKTVAAGFASSSIKSQVLAEDGSEIGTLLSDGKTADKSLSAGKRLTLQSTLTADLTSTTALSVTKWTFSSAALAKYLDLTQGVTVKIGDTEETLTADQLTIENGSCTFSVAIPQEKQQLTAGQSLQVSLTLQSKADQGVADDLDLVSDFSGTMPDQENNAADFVRQSVSYVDLVAFSADITLENQVLNGTADEAQNVTTAKDALLGDQFLAYGAQGMLQTVVTPEADLTLSSWILQLDDVAQKELLVTEKELTLQADGKEVGATCTTQSGSLTLTLEEPLEVKAGTAVTLSLPITAAQDTTTSQQAGFTSEIAGTWTDYGTPAAEAGAVVYVWLKDQPKEIIFQPLDELTKNLSWTATVLTSKNSAMPRDDKMQLAVTDTYPAAEDQGWSLTATVDYGGNSNFALLWQRPGQTAVPLDGAQVLSNADTGSVRGQTQTFTFAKDEGVLLESDQYQAIGDYSATITWTLVDQNATPDPK